MKNQEIWLKSGKIGPFNRFLPTKNWFSLIFSHFSLYGECMWDSDGTKQYNYYRNQKFWKCNTSVSKDLQHLHRSPLDGFWIFCYFGRQLNEYIHQIPRETYWKHIFIQIFQSSSVLVVGVPPVRDSRFVAAILRVSIIFQIIRQVSWAKKTN
jgi:hypothetical protein